KLHHILAGKGARTGEPQDETAVEKPATLGVSQMPQARPARLGKFPCDGRDAPAGARPRDPHDGHSGTAKAAGKREERVVRTGQSFFSCFLVPPEAALAIWFQKVFCSCSHPWKEAGSQFLKSASGSIPSRALVIRFCISCIRASCRGATSGSPRKLRASAGVQSISIDIFMAPTLRFPSFLQPFIEPRATGRPCCARHSPPLTSDEGYFP